MVIYQYPVVIQKMSMSVFIIDDETSSQSACKCSQSVKDVAIQRMKQPTLRESENQY